MLQKTTVEKETFKLLTELMDEPLLSSTRLVGGTALALQLGHRKSTDLDLFTVETPNIDEIVSMLQTKYNYLAQHISEKTTIGYIDGIKIDVINHPYKWLFKPITENNLRLASPGEITAMKLHAITNSGQRPKDFVDLAFLSQYYSYDKMVEMALKKYPMYDPIMIDKAIIYFDDVNTEQIENVHTIGYKMNWNKIKSRIVKMTDNPQKIFETPPLKQIEKKNSIKPR